MGCPRVAHESLVVSSCVRVYAGRLNKIWEVLRILVESGSCGRVVSRMGRMAEDERANARRGKFPGNVFKERTGRHRTWSNCAGQWTEMG